MKYDVAIIGAGILGLSHAYAAAKRGLNVLICERTDRPLGASIRNFGFGVVMGQREGEMLSLAKQSRNIWGEWIENANLHALRNGSLLLARNPLEASVLESFADNKAQKYGYDCELLSRPQIADIYDGRFSDCSAILHGKEDQVMFSRETIPQIIAYLPTLSNVKMKFATLVKDVGMGVIETTRGTYQAEHIIVCSGHDYHTLLADELNALAPMVCKLQMMRVRPTEEINLQHALFTGLSCTHYDAFCDLPETEQLREYISTNHPNYVKDGIHLLVTPTPYGDLIIGDSHEYSQYPQPFNSEEIDRTLLKLAESTLKTSLNVVERWVGEYGSKGTEPYSIIKTRENVTAVLMRTGLGMSVGPALGENIIADLVD